MSNEIRYGVGSLEEEIRLRRDQIQAGATFETTINEELVEGTQWISMKPTKDNMLGGLAKVTMAPVRGKLVFTVEYDGGKTLKGLSVQKLAGLVR